MWYNKSMENRKEKMQEMRDRGFSYSQIASVWSISRQRVHQILSGYERNLKALGNGWYGTMRTIVMARDNNKCTKCGSAKHLVIHHLDHNDNHNGEMNLITLCSSCHTSTHMKR